MAMAECDDRRPASTLRSPAKAAVTKRNRNAAQRYATVGKPILEDGGIYAHYMLRPYGACRRYASCATTWAKHHRF